jgi:hypothetical protein
VEDLDQAAVFLGHLAAFLGRAAAHLVRWLLAQPLVAHPRRLEPLQRIPLGLQGGRVVYVELGI